MYYVIAIRPHIHMMDMYCDMNIKKILKYLFSKDLNDRSVALGRPLIMSSLLMQMVDKIINEETQKILDKDRMKFNNLITNNKNI